ncbi:uncharacterized protein LAESUDRAFT_751555 [Laetiporus sulphureus 93-53]|uniref:Uncharacterized protein n=1 Tax=Laetiporus sulphureus 93-53 TaxID=1314785 RepID=A0A165CV43_9APHY|nr:uncharacterized protein LAESUDRAFT_751555 [Laetiporus sulphureus 93-53]KZT03482.1 hypothetical protein LAESUDRAFT_751555 [Laetiporus sulphureus 93-53]
MISFNGKTATAMIMDEWRPGRPEGGLDFSESLFQYFSNLNVGVLTGEWCTLSPIGRAAAWYAERYWSISEGSAREDDVDQGSCEVEHAPASSLHLDDTPSSDSSMMAARTALHGVPPSAARSPEALSSTLMAYVQQFRRSLAASPTELESLGQLPFGPQRRGRRLVRRSPIAFEEPADEPDTFPDSGPANDADTKEKDELVDELEGEKEIEPASEPEAVTSALLHTAVPSVAPLLTGLAEEPANEPSDGTRLPTLVYAMSSSSASRMLPVPRLLRCGRHEELLHVRVRAHRARAKTKRRFWSRKGIPNPDDTTGWIPLRELYERRGWRIPDEPSLDELSHSRRAFKEYDDQIRALNKSGVNLKATMEEYKELRSGRHVPRRAVPLLGTTPIIGPSSEVNATGSLVKVSFNAPEPKAPVVKTPFNTRGTKRVNPTDAEDEAPSSRRSRHALHGTTSKASPSSAPVTVKKDKGVSKPQAGPFSSRAGPSKRSFPAAIGTIPFVSIPPAPYPTQFSAVSPPTASSSSTITPSANFVEINGQKVPKDLVMMLVEWAKHQATE